ncbi:hypothetical protein SB49_07980 [Sediminicola sp. YIK13]|uniref:hypothetical protein n=1 Tax=Sediminicola sp. YIK13 TaxID=1453352 RepID=UPI00071FF403|nr:hypothetical protein [Sediminicola sp. YIK13]ALM07749.1 hypothetical protein SB49_07980 [Sediminicola sp. YIK13]
MKKNRANVKRNDNSSFIYLLRDFKRLEYDSSREDIVNIISIMAKRFRTDIKSKVLNSNTDYKIKFIVKIVVYNLRMCQNRLSKIKTRPEVQLVVKAYIDSYSDTIKHFKKEYAEICPEAFTYENTQEAQKKSKSSEIARIFRDFGFQIFSSWIEIKNTDSDIAYVYRKLKEDKLIFDYIGESEFINFLYDNDYVDHIIGKLKSLHKISAKGRLFEYNSLKELHSKN